MVLIRGYLDAHPGQTEGIGNSIGSGIDMYIRSRSF